MTEPLIAADSIDFSVKEKVILRSVYVDAVPGTITALVGRSGAGKSTLFWIMVGLKRAQSGQVCWAGMRLERPRLHALARLGLAFGPDRPFLSPGLSTADHLRMIDGNAGGLGVDEWIDRPTGTLSGGEQRLSEIAVLLGCRPRVLVLDEPFRGLAPAVRDRIADVLRQAAAAGVAVLYADHDVTQVHNTADRLFSMENGMTRRVEGFKERPLHEWYHAWPQ
ncbi:MAG TPA: ATP-binding cassette domain-containing protein [Gemmatimonadales bacterium]|nr:ATP-binding cassette domain-containing protein [Gemmatimonadales bacterium]